MFQKGLYKFDVTAENDILIIKVGHRCSIEKRPLDYIIYHWILDYE